MEVLQQIKSLMGNASSIRNLFKEKVPKWKKDEKHYDKTGFGFNLDDRFTSCESIPVHFDSWMGVYGSSGSSSQLSLDRKIFGTHLLHYLNKNKETIMLAIADQIERQAAELKEKAEKELNNELTQLRSIGAVPA